MRSLSKRASALLLSSVTGIVLFAGISPVFADDHTGGVPVLSSRPGAAYTIYLDPSGFNYVGAWNGTDTTDPDGNPTGGQVPGFTPSLDGVAATGTFNTSQQAAITTIWTRVAQSYIGLNVNVTTVDPAVAAGQAGTDTARRNFYDATPNMMHTVLGSSERAAYVNDDKNSPNYNPTGNWLPGADGVSPGIGVVAGRVDGPNALQGQHTNFMFTQGQATGTGTISNANAEYIGGISAHENAHSFGLLHQGDYTGGGVNHINEYSTGDDRTAPGQIGTYVPIIGDANSAQRIAWRVGTADNQVNGIYQQQNDLKVMLATDTAAAATAAGRTGGADLHFVEDGKGHNRLAAGSLALAGTTVDFTQNKGVIVPVSETDPNPKGASNYTQDWYKFTVSTTSAIDFVAHDSTDFLTPGIADSDGTLRSTMAVFDSAGLMIGTAAEDASTMFETYDGDLAAGTYFLALSSFGGHDQINAAGYDPATYFDTGAYFLTGSIMPVPEPTMVCFFAISAIGMLRRRRSAN